MLESLVSDILVRVVGLYLVGITPETVSLGVWGGDLSLRDLTVRPDALAVLLETLGLDLPVTCLAGNVGSLTLCVPWKALRSSSVVLTIRDLVVVASPVSDGDQAALAARDARLKAAHLQADDALRDAKFSVRATARLARWRQKVTSTLVATVVRNLQVVVENVIVQYQDASSVRDRPYTVTLAVDSMRFASTDAAWVERFADATAAEAEAVAKAEAGSAQRTVYKVLHVRGLLANWVPGIGDTSHTTLSPAEWAEKLRGSSERRVIHPMHGRLRMALVADAADAPASTTPKADMDLCFPDVKLAFDDFQYHTLLSTIMYLSDIDRKVRPKSPKGRWLWALERLLPRFKKRQAERRTFSADGLRQRREKRELYVSAWKAVREAKVAGKGDLGAVATKVSVLRDMEVEMALADVLLFRDVGDRDVEGEQMPDDGPAQASPVTPASPAAATSAGFWGGFGLGLRGVAVQDESAEGSAGAVGSGVMDDSYRLFGQAERADGACVGLPGSVDDGMRAQGRPGGGGNNAAVAPTVRFAFMLGRGSIELSRGGYPTDPVGISRLIFHELRLGVTTWRGDQGLLIEALLGTLDVLDLQTSGNAKVMYPRVEWSGHSGSEVTGDEASYPSAISSALEQIRGSYVKPDPALFRPTSAGLETSVGALRNHTLGSHSYSSSSIQSDASSASSMSGKHEDISQVESEPLDYVVALRLQQEDVGAEDSEPVLDALKALQDKRPSRRLALDIAIGGMEAIVDGPRGSFVSSCSFWHPREKLPSIMQFLGRAAAPRLAALRMDLQKLLDRKAPMRIDMMIRGPRFLFPGPRTSSLALVVDLGTFAMETMNGLPVQKKGISSASMCGDVKLTPVGSAPMDNSLMLAEASSQKVDLGCTNYRFTGSDLGIYVVSAAGRKAAERLVRPLSLRILLQVLNDASYVEAVLDPAHVPSLARVSLFGRLSSVNTTISQSAFQKLLKVAQQWSKWTSVAEEPSGIEPNSPLAPSSSSPLADDSHPALPVVSTAMAAVPAAVWSGEVAEVPKAQLVKFDMRLELDNLKLELRDMNGRRVVTLSSRATEVKFLRTAEVLEIDYRLRELSIDDGSRGATAPYRRLLYAGDVKGGKEESQQYGGAPLSTSTFDQTEAKDKNPLDCNEAVRVHYVDDTVQRKQDIAVHVMSLSIVCVRETYIALADFLYRSEDADKDEYVDPFASVGTTTSAAVLALRDKAGQGVELSKRALVNRGQLKVSAVLDGFDVVFIAAEGAIASFYVSECTILLSQSLTGDVRLSGAFGCLRVRDLTAAYDMMSETLTYHRDNLLGLSGSAGDAAPDGWTLDIPVVGDKWFKSQLTNLRIVYVQRFVVLFKQYLSALLDELEPVLSLDGGLLEVFDGEEEDRWKSLSRGQEDRVRIDIVTEKIDVLMPRHSQSPHEGLRFCISKSAVTNEELAAPGYLMGARILTSGVSSYVMYSHCRDGEEANLQTLSFSPCEDLVPFSDVSKFVAKLDIWRTRRVPKVVFNEEGTPVLKEGELEQNFDPQQWLPALRVRVVFAEGLTARLCEAEYSLLYFTFTENIIERPEIEFTDIVRGLKTPILPPRVPVEPIMLSSNRMPPNYSVMFDIATISSVILAGGEPDAEKSRLIGTELENIVGRFDYGIDYRLSFELSCNIDCMEDLRPVVKRHPRFIVKQPQVHRAARADGLQEHDVVLNWDRPYGHRANVMLVVSRIRVIVVPELFRDLGALTPPGFPYLALSAPAPYLRFCGRLLIVTLADPEIWLMTDEFEGDHRGLVMRGDVIAKVQWAAVTGRQLLDLASKGIRVGLSNRLRNEDELQDSHGHGSSKADSFVETPLIYPLDVSVQFHAGGFDPPSSPDGKPVQAPGSTLSINAESLLGRVDVKDTATLLAVGSKLVLLQPSELSSRPYGPGRFDEFAEIPEDGDAKLSVHFALPHGRILFTDESAGRHVPVMELRARDALLRSNVPWLTNGRVELSVDLFNEKEGWWEPGIEHFPVEITASQGRSGSLAVNARANESIEVNLTPSTVSGAARVGKSIKSAVEGLQARLKYEKDFISRAQLSDGGALSVEDDLERNVATASAAAVAAARRADVNSNDGQRPSVAAFCFQNQTGRPVAVWQPHTSQRQLVRGDGGEVEMDLPSEDIMWSALVDEDGSEVDANRNRRATMRCYVTLVGYEAVTLSAAEVGVECISMTPELSRSKNAESFEDQDYPPSLRLAFEVTMRDGVPVGCLRSLVRLRNETKTVLELFIGRCLPKSSSVSLNLRSGTTSTLKESTESGHDVIVLEAGSSYCVPLQSVGQPIRVRPALFRAPDDEEDASTEVDEAIVAPEKKRVSYAHEWSEVLSSIDTFCSLADSAGSPKAGSPKACVPDSVLSPVFACKSTSADPGFYFSVKPTVSRVIPSDLLRASTLTESWVDLLLRAPVVLRNLLPRSLAFVLVKSRKSAGSETGAGPILARGVVEPLREAHLHSVGRNLNRVSFGANYDNICSRDQPKSRAGSSGLVARSVRGKLLDMKTIPLGASRSTSLSLRLDHSGTLSHHKVSVFADFWIENRSNVDLFFRDSARDVRGSSGSSSSGKPKTLLQSCTTSDSGADPFICFSGKWLSFQKADATEDVWVHIGEEVTEIGDPTPLPFGGLGLALDVRPARGEFQRSLVVTVRNTAWIQNMTSFVLQWCQPSALSSRGIVLSSLVHTIEPGSSAPLHWDFSDEDKAVCLRRVEADGTSQWIWSRPVRVGSTEGEFAAKMYRPNRHEQYIARAVVSKLKSGVYTIAVHAEDRSAPPYRIVNDCKSRSVAFRQAGVGETHPWLVRPGKATRYSWDDPSAPLKRRLLVVEVIEGREGSSDSSSNAALAKSSPVKGGLENVGSSEDTVKDSPPRPRRPSSDLKRHKFELSIDAVSDAVSSTALALLNPPLSVSVSVDGPTKVVTFKDSCRAGTRKRADSRGESSAVGSTESRVEESSERSESVNGSSSDAAIVNLDIEFFVKSIGISMVDSTPLELLYAHVSGVLLRLDRFDSSELVMCEVADIQVDNQLPTATWPVLLWSPPPGGPGKEALGSSQPRHARPQARKPVVQVTTDGKHPRHTAGITCFRGVFVALQHLEIAADEECVLRLLLFVQSILEASGEAEFTKSENVSPSRVDEVDAKLLRNARNADFGDSNGPTVLVRRLYVEALDLCPLHVTVSFSSSRTPLAGRVVGYRSIIRTLMALFGNVEHAEFRFNALELRHVFDTTTHFQSLIAEFYVAQGLGQKMALLTSNPLVGNPSALFDSIAIGTRDFFVEPARAKSSAEFIAGIGRGSSSLLTNTVGGIVGSLGGIPRAVAQGLETAVGDKDYLAARDSIRGRARFSSSPAQGLLTGAMSLGHGIASGATGLVRDPVMGAMESGAEGFIRGLGRGVFGGVLKPLTGALDLIGEPAVGFRSMMTSVNRDFAEPLRPARAFWGSNANRLETYDLHAALGQSVLGSIGRLEEKNSQAGSLREEELWAWSPLVAVELGTSSQDLLSYLWALRRRSLPSSQFRSRAVADGRGVLQRAEKMRCGLVTQLRLLVASLDGQVLWEHPLVDIVGTQVSREKNDFLMVGILPVGSRLSKRNNPPPSWEKIACGSSSRRDALNSAIKKALLVYQTNPGIGPASPVNEASRFKRNFSSKEGIEMVDMSGTGPSVAPAVEEIDEEGSCGKSDCRMDGMTSAVRRSSRLVDEAVLGASIASPSDSARSLRMTISNTTSSRLDVVKSKLSSGVWILNPSDSGILGAGCSLSCIGSCGDEKVCDISGGLVLRFENKGDGPGTGYRGEAEASEAESTQSDVVICFMIPMLEKNEYAISTPQGVTVSRRGGDQGEHANVSIVISENS